jgi:hypothetical protein
MDIPESVSADLKPLTDALYEVIERAVADAQAYLDAKRVELRGPDGDDAIDPYVFSQLVRFYASELLASSSFAELGYRLERLPNCGIYLEYLGYLIRLWKADEGKLPAPGASLSKQDFYQQPLFAEDRPRKLAVLWETYKSGKVSLILACPSGEGEPWQPGQSHWELTIPHPATTSEQVRESVAVDDFDDLTFDRKINESDDNR